MIITVDPSNPKPTYLQIVDSIRRAIATGAVKPGDQLPTIRDVAVQARVNRNTVSRAYLELEHMGLVRSRQGSGSFLTDNEPGLDQKERLKIIKRIADELALEASHYKIPLEQVIAIVRDSAAELNKETEHE
ncbi:MAG TPA: GntR family transcriptional regulator [bacterium]|nr:GntR family transcriptional regulator [bacterium]HOL96844.1 GntR family transcriptional regulator [bacterium]HPP00398.1 GntR family transcriptional regulator [bacterium]HXK95739.1 GntR family transcriptional regulator [bacterium]